MKIKLDENLPARAVEILAAVGNDVDSVPQEGLAGQSDAHVWAAAQRSGRFFITQDLDFSDVRTFEPGRHHGLLVVRLSEPSRTALVARLRSIFESEDVSAWERCFVVVTQRKIRVRSPK